MPEPLTLWNQNPGFTTGEIAYDDASTTYDSATTMYDGAAAGVAPINSSQDTLWADPEPTPNKTAWADATGSDSGVLWSAP